MPRESYKKYLEHKSKQKIPRSTAYRHQKLIETTGGNYI